MTCRIKATGEACGAVVADLDLTRPLDAETVAALRRAWLDHHVLIFPEQRLDNDGLERFAEYFGLIGDDPFFAPIADHSRIAAIRRDADETGRLFADSWHSDWSFMARPPAGTCLLGLTIPPVGGDTLLCNQSKAWEAMPDALRRRLEGRRGLHSAGRAYADDGKYAADKYDGAMDIVTSDEAKAVGAHDIVRAHPESGRRGIFAGSYVFDLEGGDEAGLLGELSDWLARPEFIYRHRWAADMLVLWDNRAVLHKATGGYEGHARLLHRLTIADDPRYYTVFTSGCENPWVI